MNKTQELKELFSLRQKEGLDNPSHGTAFHASSLAFLEQVHRHKSDALKELVEEHGWPDAKKTNPHVEETAFTIILHSDYDLEFQKKCHALMISTAALGITKIGYLAFLTDRILCNMNHHQRFGTQIREAENGSFVPKPMEDPDHIDELRERAGLHEKLVDYYQRVNDGDMLLYRYLLNEPEEDSNVLPFPGKDS
jgi:hypothetical protein